MPAGQSLDHEILIVGSGISGISSALALLKGGFRDFVILETADGPGGVWRENRYPGVACDIPSILYQFRDEKNPNWSKLYAGGDEIVRYLKDVQAKHRLNEKTRYGMAVNQAEYDEAKGQWRVTVSSGETLRCRYLIKATGAFNSPKMPDIPGLDNFKGELFHTARWPDGIDLAGKRIAVIGTGASAIQLVPIVAKSAGQLTVYQRTPIWLLPKPDFKVAAPLRWGMKHLPGYQDAYYRAFYKSLAPLLQILLVTSGKHPRLHGRLEAAGRWNIRRQLKDPELIRKFTPDYSLGCKRPSFSNDYYRTFEKPNVSLQTEGIAKITRDGILAQGEKKAERFDVIIMATGFNILGEASTSLPAFPVAGRDGLDLREYWHQTDDFKAFRGAAVAGFPNLFLNLGIPFAGGTSWYETADMISAQIVECLQTARDSNRPEIEVKAEAVERYMEEMDGRLKWSIHRTGSCATSNSYYYDKHGKNPLYTAEPPEETWARAISDVAKSYEFRRLAGPVGGLAQAS